jgi:hypothetical protein
MRSWRRRWSSRRSAADRVVYEKSGLSSATLSSSPSELVQIPIRTERRRIEEGDRGCVPLEAVIEKQIERASRSEEILLRYVRRVGVLASVIREVAVHIRRHSSSVITVTSTRPS